MLAAIESTPFTLSPWSLTPLIAGVVLVVLLALLGKVPVRYNLRSLTVRWRTTVVTALAFTLVISLMTVMLAFVNGMYKLTQGSGQPGNVLVLSEGSTDEAFSNLGFSDLGDIELLTGVLRDDAGRPLASRETYVVVNQPMQVRQPGRPRGRFTQLRGLEDAELSGRVHGLTLEPGGRWISREGVQSRENGKADAIQCVIGEGIARELGRDRLPEQLAAAKNKERLEVGETFSLGGRTWVAVGIIRYSGSTFDSEIWAKRDIVGTMFGKPNYTSIVLRTAGAAEAARLKEFLNNEFSKAAVQAYLETEYFASLGETNKQFLVSIIIVTFIMSVGGIFGVANTMFAAVSQRLKDIGVLRILGYSRLHVQASFLLESLVIALAGGALGCTLGCLSHGWQATSVISRNEPGSSKFVVLEMAVTGDTIAVGLAVALVIGLLGGLLPSIKAMFVRPLETLR
jgi:ABC-type antimicrobial peptide transport system permease subunit